MKEIDITILKETKYIAICTGVMNLFMQCVFWIIGRWSYSVLLAGILSCIVSVSNFFLMGISLQKALSSNEKDTKKIIRFSQIYRTFLIFVVTVAGVVLPYFNTPALLISLFFSRIAIALRPVFRM